MAVNTYVMSINANAGGQFVTNVIHYSFDDASFVSTEQAAAGLISAWDTAMRTKLRNILPTAVTLLTLKARRVATPTVTGGFEATGIISGSVLGTRTGLMQAAGICPCIIFYPLGNARQRGRFFISGITDTDCVDGYITGTILTAINTFVGGLLTPLTVVGGSGPTATFGVYSRVTRVFRACQTGQISDLVGQVRRRQRPA